MEVARLKSEEKKAWRVTFSEGTSLAVVAPDEAEAKNEAAAQAWLASGEWWEITKVEEL